jgi:S1-C subfamily serine protease
VPRDQVGVVIHSILGADPGTDLLEEGDLVVEVNRRSTPDVRAYRQILGSLPEGQSAWLYVYRPDPPGSFLTRVQVEGRR